MHKTHIVPMKIDEQFFAEVSLSDNNYSFRRYNNATTTTTTPTTNTTTRPVGGRGARCTSRPRYGGCPHPRRLVPDTLRWTLGRTPGRHHTVEQIVDPVPEVPLLHVIVPQMVEQLVDILTPSRSPCSRPGYRSAQDCVSTPSCSRSPTCTADGGTGGSAHGRVSY